MIFVKSLDYYVPDFSAGYLSDKEAVFKGLFKYGLYAHIVSAPIILIVAVFQIFFRYERKFGNLHRTLGKVYVFLTLFISAPGAFILSFYAFGGLWSVPAFILLTSLWFYYTFRAYRAARSGQYQCHKRFMIRSFICTLSAINLRLFSYLLVHFFDLSGPGWYALTIWLSWLPFLLFYEILILSQKKSGYISV